MVWSIDANWIRKRLTFRIETGLVCHAIASIIVAGNVALVHRRGNNAARILPNTWCYALLKATGTGAFEAADAASARIANDTNTPRIRNAIAGVVVAQNACILACCDG